jgi:hypothetical protein
MKTCPRCNTPVAMDAVFCSRCGFQYQAQQMPPQQQYPFQQPRKPISPLAWIFGGCCAAPLFLVILLIALGSGPHTHNGDCACIVSHEVVRNQLRSPSTADFPSCIYADKRKMSDGSFVVSSYVDSQNGFGAMLRTRYTIRLLPTGKKSETVIGGGWTVLDIKIE